MKKYLKKYESDFEKALNISLMKKEHDRPLVDYIKEAWKSLEVLKNIKILKFEYDDSESSIDINKFIFKRDKKKRKKERYKYKFVNDDRCGCLTIHIQLTVEEYDPELRKNVISVEKLVKKMLIPLQDDDGYYFIKGKKYYIIYQLVDKSTYTSTSSVTLKSLMGIAVKRHSIKVENIGKNSTNVKDVNGTEYTLPVYNVFVFRKETPVILFYAANGMDWALSYLGLDNILKIRDNINTSNDTDNLYFQISSKCYIEVNKSMFLKYPFVQSIVGGLLEVSTNRMTVESIYNPDTWIKILSGNSSSMEKGRNILTYLNRMLDETTKKELLLNEHNKEDAYAILRWIMQNFNELRLKDNLSLENKRLRCNEYIASLLTLEFSERLKNVMTLGSKATMENYINMFKFSGDILIQKMHSSGILQFDDILNDMDFFSKFKYTTKGPHSLGGKNSNTISIKYRGIHPTFLGNIDLLVCGNSDPGTSGVLSPFGNIKSLYFNNSKEPDEYEFDFKQDISNIMKDKNVEYIEMKFNNKVDYYNMLDRLAEFNKTAITISGTSKDSEKIIVRKYERKKSKKEEESGDNDE